MVLKIQGHPGLCILDPQQQPCRIVRVWLAAVFKIRCDKQDIDVDWDALQSARMRPAACTIPMLIFGPWTRQKADRLLLSELQTLSQRYNQTASVLSTLCLR